MAEKTRRGFFANMGLLGAAAAAVSTGAPGDPIIKGPDGHEFSQVEGDPSIKFDTAGMFRNNFMDVQKGRLYGSAVFQDMRSSAGGLCLTVNAHTDLQVVDILSYPIGGSRTLADTNIIYHNQLFAPEAFLIERVGLVISPAASPDDRSVFLENSHVELRVNQKIYFRRPSVDLFSVGAMHSPKDSELPVSGLVALDPLPLFISSGQRFSFLIYFDWPWAYHLFPELQGPVKFWGVLDGLHARGVQ